MSIYKSMKNLGKFSPDVATHEPLKLALPSYLRARVSYALTSISAPRPRGPSREGSLEASGFIALKTLPKRRGARRATARRHGERGREVKGRA